MHGRAVHDETKAQRSLLGTFFATRALGRPNPISDPDTTADDRNSLSPRSLALGRPSARLGEIGPNLGNGLTAARLARTGLSNFIGCSLALSPRRAPYSWFPDGKPEFPIRLLRKATGRCHRGEIQHSTKEKFP